jgi:hypothetical protein
LADSGRVDWNRGQQFVLPVTLTILSVATIAGVARWRLLWRTGIAALPPLLPATFATLAWAWLEMPVEWAPAWAAAAAVGYLAPAVADQKLRESWQNVALSFGAGAVAVAALVVAGTERGASAEYVLPLTLAIGM